MRTLFLQHVDSNEPRTIAVGLHLHVGRGPHNGVVLATPDVSWSHAVLHLEDHKLVAEDLGSRNGTWVDGVRIEQPTQVRQNVRIGDYLLTPRDDTVTRPDPVSLLLEETRSRIRYPLAKGSFLIGDAPGANIRVENATPEILTIVDGIPYIHNKPLDLPWEGRLGSINIRVFQPDSRWSPTLPDTTRFAPRRLKVGLQPPQAVIADLEASAMHTITAPNRVSLLYFLAQSLEQDRSGEVPCDRVGWRSDEDVAVAVWGRGARGGPRNRLNTLTYRLRTELTENGLSDTLLEKKAGWVRLSDCDVEIT